MQGFVKVQKPHVKHRLWAENGLPPQGRGGGSAPYAADVWGVWGQSGGGFRVGSASLCVQNACKKQYRIDLECLSVQEGVQNACKKQYKTHLGLSWACLGLPWSCLGLSWACHYAAGSLGGCGSSLGVGFAWGVRHFASKMLVKSNTGSTWSV